MKYFRLRDNIQHPHRWYLGDVLGEDNWSLATQPAAADRLIVELGHAGTRLDFTLTNAFALPVVSLAIMDKLSVYPAVHFTPVQIGEGSSHGEFFLMTISTILDCVDEEKSRFDKFLPNDPVRPDKAGDYSAFFKLIINPAKTSGFEIFRLARFETAIVVSERVKDSLEHLSLTGLEFSVIT